MKRHFPDIEIQEILILKKQTEKVGNDIYGVKNNWKIEQRLGETADSGFHHNDHYHKYFRGYTEIRTETPNGRYCIQRFYTEDWYVQDVSDGRWIGHKLGYLLLSLYAAGSYLWFMSRPDHSGNVSRIVAIPGFIAIIFLILLLASVIGYVFAKRRMTWWEKYASSERIKRYGGFSAFLLLLTAILIFGNIFFGVENAAAEIGLGIGVLSSAITLFVLWYLEAHMPYRREKNDVELPPGEAHRIL